LKKYIDIIPAVLFFFLLWYGISLLVKQPFLPGPVTAALALINLASEGILWRHLRVSLFRIIWALVLSSIPSVILGLAAGRSSKFNKIISPFIYLFHPLPKAAFLPIIMLFFGIGEISKIFLVSFIIFSSMLVTVRDAARQIPAEYMDSVRSLGAGKTGLIRHVIIPAVIPGFFTGFRLSLGTAIAVLFFAETFASDSGLGYLIVDAWTRLAYPDMYAAILALSILGLLFFITTDTLEYFICPWNNVYANEKNKR
jgi:NitT/TauT family transport system permease protein